MEKLKQTMMHHDARPYEIAVKEAGDRARKGLEELFERGRAKGPLILKKIQDEIPTDRLVKGRALKFKANEQGLLVRLTNDEFAVHPHARNQLCQRVHLPEAYANTLMAQGEWGRELLARNFNELYTKSDDGKMADTRFLARTFGGKLKGFLSSKYRMLDTPLLFDAFAAAIRKVGAVPVDGTALETKVSMKVMLPRIFSPFPGEVIALGLSWSHSDYGDGALDIAALIIRLMCTNLATTETFIRQVHLGRRLTGDTEFSKKTKELDSRTLASATTDVVIDALSEEKTTSFCNLVKKSGEEGIDPRNIVEWLKKQGVQKGETEEIVKIFNSPDVELLPPGNTRWRMSNAISLFAGAQDDARQLDLMKVAGAMVAKAA